MREMRELFAIGEISRLFHLPVSTIRYYCDIGLVTPARVDAKTGYRYFSTEQFELLNTIKYLQALGMPLADIRVLLENRRVENFVALLEKQKEKTADKIRELTEIQEKLAARIEQIGDTSREELLDQIRIVHLPPRTAVSLDRSIEAGSDLEMQIRILENSSDMESAVFLGKVGLSVAEEDLLAGRYGRYRSMFLLVENETCNPRMMRSLEGGTYAVLRFHGTHGDAAGQYARLMKEILAQGYRVRGHSVEITLIDYGLTNDPQKFITEIQIPVDSQVT